MTTAGPRTRSAQYSKATVYHRQKLLNGKVIWTDTGEYELDVWADRMDDVVTANFQERKAAGEIINNPMAKWKSVYSGSFALSTVRVGDATYPGTNPLIEFPPISAIPEDHFSSERARATTQAFAKVNSSDTQLLVTLGELKETRALFLQCVKRLYGIVKLVKLRQVLTLKDAYRGLTDVFKKLPDYWMEYRYAWRPLIGEITTLSRMVEKLATDFQKRQTFRSFVPLKNTVQLREVRSVDGGNFQYAFYHYSTVSGGAYSGVLCEQRYAGFPDQYGLWKFGSTAWELTRLSFAVDWLFNVGKVISAWEPDTLYKVLTNWVTLRYRHTQLVTMGEMVYHKSTHSGGWSGWWRKIDTEHVERFPLEERQIIPQFVPRLTWDKSIDLVIICSQLWNQLKPRRL